MDLFAFVPFMAATAAKSHDSIKPSEPPTFEPKWYFEKYRLDARPVMWSLKNRPDDWEYAFGDSRYLKHKPSGHVFSLAFDAVGLFDSNRCGCGTAIKGQFQMFQTGKFRKAARAWREWHRLKHNPPPDPAHFAAHFTGTAS